MSQDQQSSSEQPAEKSAAPAVYTAAQLRAEVLAKTGAPDMGAFHPAAPKVATPPPSTESPVVAAPAAPPSAAPQPGGDVAAELAAMRAEVAALMRKPEPEEAPVVPEPAKPAHPLEAHAKSVLGPGAQPKHIERAVVLIEQEMQWQAFDRFHEANPSDASTAERAKAARNIDTIRREMDGLSELATLHAHLAELRAESAKAKQPDPEQQKRERSEFLTSKIFTAEVLGAHHPNLWAAMQSAPAMRTLVQEKLLALPYDTEFYSRGDAILHALESQCTPTAPPASAPAVAVPVAAAAAKPPGHSPRQVTAGEQEPVSARDFWRQVHTNFDARANT